MNYLIGHLVGDYVFQNDWMALNKKSNAWKGWLACNVHCLLYTLAVCLFTGWWDYRALLVFLSHIIFDKSMIVVWWMDFYGNFKTMRNTKPIESWLWAYAVVDNTFHLVCLWAISLI